VASLRVRGPGGREGGRNFFLSFLFFSTSRGRRAVVPSCCRLVGRGRGCRPPPPPWRGCGFVPPPRGTDGRCCCHRGGMIVGGEGKVTPTRRGMMGGRRCDATVAGRRPASTAGEANRHTLVLYFFFCRLPTPLPYRRAGDVTQKASKQTHRCRRFGFLFRKTVRGEGNHRGRKNCPGCEGWGMLFIFFLFFDERPKREDGGDGKPSQQRRGRRSTNDAAE
jgi:hypothetical protein